MAKGWKQPRCPQVGEGEQNVIQPYNGILFSLQRKEIPAPVFNMNEP